MMKTIWVLVALFRILQGTTFHSEDCRQKGCDLAHLDVMLLDHALSGGSKLKFTQQTGTAQNTTELQFFGSEDTRWALILEMLPNGAGMRFKERFNDPDKCISVATSFSPVYAMDQTFPFPDNERQLPYIQRIIVNDPSKTELIHVEFVSTGGRTSPVKQFDSVMEDYTTNSMKSLLHSRNQSFTSQCRREKRHGDSQNSKKVVTESWDGRHSLYGHDNRFHIYLMGFHTINLLFLCPLMILLITTKVCSFPRKRAYRVRCKAKSKGDNDEAKTYVIKWIYMDKRLVKKRD